MFVLIACLELWCPQKQFIFRRIGVSTSSFAGSKVEKVNFHHLGLSKCRISCISYEFFLGLLKKNTELKIEWKITQRRNLSMPLPICCKS